MYAFFYAYLFPLKSNFCQSTISQCFSLVAKVRFVIGSLRFPSVASRVRRILDSPAVSKWSRPEHACPESRFPFLHLTRCLPSSFPSFVPYLPSTKHSSSQLATDETARSVALSLVSLTRLARGYTACLFSHQQTFRYVGICLRVIEYYYFALGISSIHVHYRKNTF